MKLGSTQKERLKRIERLKHDYDQKLAALELEQKYQRDALRDPLRAEISAAIDQHDVPKRQVFLAMGFAQQNQLAAFMEPVASRAARTLDSLLGVASPTDGEPEAGITYAMVPEDGGGRGAYILMHTNGKEYYVEATDVGAGSMIFAYVTPEEWSEELAEWLAEWDGNKTNTRVKNNGYEHPKMKGRNS